ncbi:uncharacterized protein LOC133474197 [Phyllopteryx taeniolatus]|uniref:uncharacterized protein LOC133474197 n=1 Tax=Phyllopteryx taeniolatus TaxID=161469 RepID=UPI002AD2BCC1|nr:uncharacterized protein LOC133474197 [Phyllopteryx taeniolatus]
MQVFGMWEETGVPGENPPRHGENMQTPHRYQMKSVSSGYPSIRFLHRLSSLGSQVGPTTTDEEGHPTQTCSTNPGTHPHTPASTHYPPLSVGRGPPTPKTRQGKEPHSRPHSLPLDCGGCHSQEATAAGRKEWREEEEAGPSSDNGSPPPPPVARAGDPGGCKPAPPQHPQNMGESPSKYHYSPRGHPSGSPHP